MGNYWFASLDIIDTIAPGVWLHLPLTHRLNNSRN